MSKYSQLVYRGSYALITGASKGIGEAFAEVLAARGMNVVLVARSKHALTALARRLSKRWGIRAIAIDADLASPEAPSKIQIELASQHIEIDLLVNNAGFGLSGSFLSHDLDQEQAQIQVNVQALVALTYIFGGSMSARGRGGIINLASNSSFQPLPYMAGYAATKGFVLHFSEAIQHELAGRGVQVMAACPGPTATSFFDGTSTNMSSEDFDSSLSVVEKTLEAFDRGKSVAYPGRASVHVATWLSRFLPRTLVVRIAALATGKMGLHDRRTTLSSDRSTPPVTTNTACD
jgi:short-subunit dehydrogenase